MNNMLIAGEIHLSILNLTIVEDRIPPVSYNPTTAVLLFITYQTLNMA